MATLSRIFTRGSLGALLAVWSALGGAVGFAFLPVMQGWITPTAGCIIGAFVAFYVAYHNVASQLDELKEKSDSAERSAPRFRFSETRWTPLYVNGAYLFHGLQVWLKNEPEIRGHGSLARNVSITLAFHEQDMASARFKYSSQWLLTLDPNLAGFNSHVPSTDVPANDNPVKFFLVLQHPGTDDDCYAHSFGILFGAPDGRHAAYRLSPGTYRVLVTLRGDNVDQTLWLRLTNNGRQAEPKVMPI